MAIELTRRGNAAPGGDAGAAGAGPVWLQSGFRPFFLLGSLYAALALAVWLAVFAGWWTAPVAARGAGWPAVYWHGHEMLYGFVATAIAGFLLTAVPNWTGTARIGGVALAGLLGAWLAGRLTMGLAFGSPSLGLAAAVCDVVFLPLLAFAVGRPIWRAGKRHNYPVVGVLVALSLVNAAAHAGVLAREPAFVRDSLYLALYLVCVLLAIISGRIVPLFTRNALRRRGVDAAVGSAAWAERALVPVMGLTVALVWAWPRSAPAGAAALACGGLLLVRQSGWQPWHTLREPVLWVLHVGHAWLAVGFLCLGASALGDVFPASTGAHALSAGAIGTMIVGVMSRVALGHTGRPIAASPAIVAAYALVVAGGALRVFAPLVWPGHYVGSIVAAGVAWGAGYLLFAAVAAPVLVRARVDGRPG